MNPQTPSRPFPLRSVITTAVAVLFAIPSSAQASDAPRKQADHEVWEGFRALTAVMDERRWEREYTMLERAIKRIWLRNRWGDEADTFARDLACEVASIPPWKPLERLNTLSERTARRYGLSREQAARFQGAVLGEAAGFLMRNAPAIFESTREGLAARAKGEPFTPEQVAQWASRSEPLLADLRAAVQRIADQLQPMLEPDKRQLLQRDLKSFDKRQRYFNRMRARWAAGRWRPADWGMEDDPIQRADLPPSAQHVPGFEGQSPTLERRPTNKRVLAHDPDTWSVYVLQIQERYRFDAGQISAAESIHGELFHRARRYATAHADTLEKIPLRERSTHRAYEPIRSLFLELSARLNAIPTSTQRDREGR